MTDNSLGCQAGLTITFLKAESFPFLLLPSLRLSANKRPEVLKANSELVCTAHNGETVRQNQHSYLLLIFFGVSAGKGVGFTDGHFLEESRETLERETNRRWKRITTHTIMPFLERKKKKKPE